MNVKRMMALCLLLFCAVFTQVHAQTKKETPEERKARYEKINNAKIAFIADKVNLTAEQAQRFWPIYNEHEARKRDLRHKAKQFRDENLASMTDEQIQTGLENRLAYRQRELDMDKEYMERYLRVITSRQLALFYRAEREFTKLLLDRLQTASK
ncbi:hypothetical protein GU926_04730 [Nibribacter ruber]|uniref:Periplasmic heavy metal sensor n=1 Tax=Nibribacter ruber TaxID=2698458 RepID=A0A6P1NYE7_9BACT|nr:hypothetical protein [Nibribacter ruber]QHL86781.1 hypothetical protein GU926_04730 [Nibribacter ruber]